MISTENSLDAIYKEVWKVGALAEWAGAQPALHPRPPSHLFEMVADLGLGSGSRILDVGCGQGVHACELARRFGASVLAIDPLESSLEATLQLVAKCRLTALVEVERGSLERLPFAENGFDLVWCRGVIVHLRQLTEGFRECRRVLKPGGRMLLQTGYATARLEPLEEAELARQLGFIPESLRRAAVEAAFLEAGFGIVQSEQHGSEFAEFYEEQEHRCGQYLLGIARLQRSESAVVNHFGRTAYETALGVYYWQVNQMLGKISYHAYLLEKGQ